MYFIGSISAALSSLVHVPPREASSGEERGLLSWTAAGNWAYVFYQALIVVIWKWLIYSDIQKRNRAKIVQLKKQGR